MEQHRNPLLVMSFRGHTPFLSSDEKRKFILLDLGCLVAKLSLCLLSSDAKFKTLLLFS